MPFRDRFCAGVYRFPSTCLCLHLCLCPVQGALAFSSTRTDLPAHISMCLSPSLFSLARARALFLFLFLSLSLSLSPAISLLVSLCLCLCLCLCLYALQAAYAYGHDPTKRLPVPDAVYTKDPPYDMAVVDIGGKVSVRVCVRARLGVLLLSFYRQLPHLCTRTNT